MKLKLGLFLSLAILLPTEAHAQRRRKVRNSQQERSYRLPAYGMAGCGVGSLVFPHQDRRSNAITELFAATINDAPLLLPTIFLSTVQTGIVVYNPAAGLLSGGTSPQSTSIATGTSNCNESPMDYASMQMERETYVAVNLNNLNKEIAQGEGPHLRAFAEIVGCSSDDHFSKLSKVAQASHSVVFSDVVPENVTVRLVNSLKNSTEFEECLRSP